MKPTQDSAQRFAMLIVFRGIVLAAYYAALVQGLEVAFIVVTFGATANQHGVAILGGVAGIATIGGLGLATNRLITRIPRSFLQLIVGVMLTTFGTFWSLEGLGVDWPASDGTILVLLGLYSLIAFAYTGIERRRRQAVLGAIA